MSDMILRTGSEISDNGGRRYTAMQLLHSDKGGYREVYRGQEINEGEEAVKDVMLTVYAPERIADEVLMQLPEVETMLRGRLKGEQFESYRCDFTSTTDDGTKLKVIVTDYRESRSVRDTVAEGSLTQEDAWTIFSDLVCALKEISQCSNGACHFGVSPDSVFVTTDAANGKRGVVRGLHLVNDDFSTNAGLDKSVILPDYRAPESHVRPFTSKSMQFSVALLLTYMLQHEHPWDLNPTINNYSVFARIRRQKPVIKIGGPLGDILRKALSKDLTQRYDEFDEFVKAVMEHSGRELPISYTSGSDTTSAKPSTLFSRPTEEIDANEASTTKEPKVAVKLEPLKGEGLKAVAGMNDLKAELTRDFIDVVANKELAAQYGILPPGMLFYGPPGCGKTYMAEHLAIELGIETSIISPSDLGSIYIHGSQKMIADLFQQAQSKAKKNGKGVLLIFDEIDSMVPQRTAGEDNNHSGEVAEFLCRLNNSSSNGVYCIGTTNCLDLIDDAVLRKGRLDKVIYVGLPDTSARTALFEYELNKRPHCEDINLEALSKQTEGYTSSDISYIVGESARRMFADTLKAQSQKPLCISQNVIEEVIRSTRPSVTPSDMRHYEEMRDKYAHGEKRGRPRVGFAK